MSKDNLYDIVGIGLGPANMGCAALSSQTDLKTIFFEQQENFNWHKGIMIPSTTLQVPFLADFVSLVDPTNPYTFLNYLHHHNRLYKFYFLERWHILRREYNHYGQWVASQLDNCQFSSRVVDVQAKDDYFEVFVQHESDNIERYKAKNVVVGIGTKPNFIVAEEQKEHPLIHHSSQYLPNKNEVVQAPSITIVGSGQSAAEIFIDVLENIDLNEQELNWITAAPGFFPMEYSKLGLEHFTPDYIDYFYHLPKAKKEALLKNQDLLYKGIGFSTIDRIYDLLYDLSLDTKLDNLKIQANSLLENIYPEINHLGLSIQRLDTEENYHLNTHQLLLATGYKYVNPPFFKNIEAQISMDDNQQYIINRNYSVEHNYNEKLNIYSQNGELHTHGIGAPDLGLTAYRNGVILNEIIGEEHFKLFEQNTFQQFGLQQNKVAQLS